MGLNSTVSIYFNTNIISLIKSCSKHFVAVESDVI